MRVGHRFWQIELQKALRLGRNNNIYKNGNGLFFFILGRLSAEPSLLTSLRGLSKL